MLIWLNNFKSTLIKHHIIFNEHHPNKKKSKYLYDYIDEDDFYTNDIEIKNRSRMNIPFKLANDDLTKIFVEKAEQDGLYALKGHRLVGGLRASLYNAMPFDGVECLVEFMKDFKKYNTWQKN